MIKIILKHYVKLLIGRSDPHWRFFVFEQKINPLTWKNREYILAWAEKCLKKKSEYEDPRLYAESDNPLVRQGYELKQKTEKYFKNIFARNSSIKILIHTPDQRFSPGGYSLFTNISEAFEFIGIPTRILGWNDSTKKALDEFRPNILLSSDHSAYLEKIDWGAIAEYRKNNSLRIGLTAGLAEYGNTPLLERLDWAEKRNIDFYYSFRDSDYVRARKEYRPFFDKGYKILFLPFGANILHYYPVPNITKDVDYAFLASTNKAKALRYMEYIMTIVSKYQGVIDGPGWQKIKNFNFNSERDRYVYARSKVGLNIHLQEQIDWAGEINERAFMLAACGVPQIIDNAKLLPKLFSENAFFVAKNPKEYRQYFKIILNNPEVGMERALIAQKEVFKKHTSFHRAEDFIKQLKNIIQ